MKSIGLIGGMSWESTVMYYQVINREVGRRLGGLHSAPLAMMSVDFEEIALRQKQGDWEGMATMLSDAARSLVRAGRRLRADRHEHDAQGRGRGPGRRRCAAAAHRRRGR